MGYLMGIDLGTQSIKIVVINEFGDIIGSSSKTYEIMSPQTCFIEQSPQVWWDACCECINKIFHKSDLIPSNIDGIGLSGQMHGLVALDSDFNILRPAILHCDARSGIQVESIRQIIDNELLFSEIYNPIYTGFLLPSLLWVRDCEPLIYQKIQYVMLPKDYLRFRLTGEIATDYSDASGTLAFDIKNLQWSKRILRLLNISPDLFPPCGPSHEVFSCVSKSAAVATGLTAGTPVVLGGADQVMQSIGNGAINNQWATINIGSSGQVSYTSDFPVLNQDFNTNTFCGYEEGKWFTMGAIMTAGLSLKWFENLTGQHDDSEIDKLAPSGMLFLPYLNGERTPHLNPNLCGMFSGIKLNSTKSQMARAVMEGVSFALLECMDVCGNLGLTAEKTVVSGGGAKSVIWRQIQADIYNIPLYAAKNTEQASAGAAITAGVGIGLYKDMDEACRAAVKYEDRITYPNSRMHEKYMEYYSLFKQTYSVNSTILEKL